MTDQSQTNVPFGSFDVPVVTGKILLGALAIGIYNWWRGVGKWYCYSFWQKIIRLVQELQCKR